MLMFVNNFDITFLLTKEYELHYILNLKSCFGKIIHLERDICKENGHLGDFLQTQHELNHSIAQFQK